MSMAHHHIAADTGADRREGAVLSMSSAFVMGLYEQSHVCQSGYDAAQGMCWGMINEHTDTQGSHINSIKPHLSQVIIEGKMVFLDRKAQLVEMFLSQCLYTFSTVSLCLLVCYQGCPNYYH